MNISKIKPEDINLLTKLFQLPEQVIIYDPKRCIERCSMDIVRDVTTLLKRATLFKVCINLSDEKLEILPFDFILEFNKSRQPYKSFFCEQFLTINNPDGSIRWLQPKGARQANFLNLYNGSGIKALLFRVAANIAFYLRIQKVVCQDVLCLYSKKEGWIQKYFDQKEFALFTGTPGENRKAVAAICKNGQATHFIKIPISKTAKSLIQAENKHLETINTYDFEKLVVPVPIMNKLGLQLTNVRPKEPLPSITITDLHIKALKDLYANTVQVKILSSLDIYQQTVARLEEIRQVKATDTTNISAAKVERLTYNLRVLLKRMDEKQLIPIAYAHGDFTPWNMFVAEHRIHLYDWELAMPEQLCLYDAFHFVFQSSVLILHQPFAQIRAKINELKIRADVIDIIERYGLNYWDCYLWYLVYNCSYYLDMYIKQDKLHMQAYWLLDCWVNATSDAIKTIPRKVAVVS